MWMKKEPTWLTKYDSVLSLSYERFNISRKKILICECHTPSTNISKIKASSIPSLSVHSSIQHVWYFYEPNLCTYRRDMTRPQWLSYICEKKTGHLPLTDHSKEDITIKNKTEGRTQIITILLNKIPFQRLFFD